jgi:hypothetical protein
MAIIYVAIDGDDIGRMVGHAALSNDEEFLSKISAAINEAREDVQHLAEIHGGEVISSGGDEIIVKFVGEDEEKLLQDVHEMIQKVADHSKEHYGFTITAGLGNRLDHASKALMAGKLNGKNQVVDYSEDVDHLIEGIKSGKIPPQHKELNEEEFQKLYDEYIKFLNEKEKPKELEYEMVDGRIVIDEHPIFEKKDEHFKKFLENKEGQDDSESDEEKDLESQTSLGSEKDVGEQDNERQGAELGREEEANEGLEAKDIERANKTGSVNTESNQGNAEGDSAGIESGGSEQDVAGTVDEEERQLESAEEQEHDPEFDALIAEIHEYIKVFKSRAPELENLRETDPELYEAMLGMLSSLIDTIRQAKGIPESEEGDEELDRPQEQKKSGSLASAAFPKPQGRS